MGDKELPQRATVVREAEGIHTPRLRGLLLVRSDILDSGWLTPLQRAHFAVASRQLWWSWVCRAAARRLLEVGSDDHDPGKQDEDH